MTGVFKTIMMCAAFLLCACVPQDQVQELALDIQEECSLTLDPNGEKRIVGFSSSLPWIATVVEGSWIELSPESGEAGSRYIEIKAGANMTPAARNGIVEIFSAGKSMEIDIVQESAFVEKFSLSQNSFEVPAEGGKVEVTVSTNVDYRFDILDDWIQEESTRALEEKTHVLVVSANQSEEERHGTVTFCANQMCIPVTIIQAGSEGGNSGGGDQGGNNGGSVEAGDGDWTTSDFVHRSLGMRVTADWCYACPYLATSFEAARELMPDKFEVVSLHASGGLKFDAASYMIYPYNVSGYPTGIIDGRAKVPNYTSSSLVAEIIKTIVVETEANYPTTSGIEVSSTLDGSDLKVNLSLYLKKADDYNVTVLLLEDDIIGYQQQASGATYDYDHDHVAISALSSYTGDAVSTDSDNVKWSRTYSATVPSGSDKDNLKVLVFVKKPYGSQARVEDTYYGQYNDFLQYDTYIDNCRVVKVGTDAQLELKSE